MSCVSKTRCAFYVYWDGNPTSHRAGSEHTIDLESVWRRLKCEIEDWLPSLDAFRTFLTTGVEADFRTMLSVVRLAT